jgi:cytochrome P450
VTTIHERVPPTEFDHHDPSMVQNAHEQYAALRSSCPVAYSSAHEGFWVVSTYEGVQIAARDDARFSSAHDDEHLRGIALPPMASKIGIIETDPPRFNALRKAFVPWFAPGAAEARRADVQQLTDFAVDQIIAQGQADLTEEICAKVPALFTMQFLGFPASDSEWMGSLFHRHASVHPDDPDRAVLEAEVHKLGGQLYERAAQLREEPTDDFMSFMSTLKIDNELLPLTEVAENAFLLLAGGLDTTTALLAHTFVYLNDKPDVRRELLADPRLVETAFDECLRYYSPVQGLA